MSANAAGLRRLLPVGWDGGVRAAVDRLAERHAFEASEGQRAEISRRAQVFLDAPAAED